MSSKWRSSVKGVSKTLLTLLLGLQATHSLMNSPSMNAYSDDSVDYTKFRSVAEVRAAAERNIALANREAMDALALPIESAPVSVQLALVNEVIVESSVAAHEPSAASDEGSVVNESERVSRNDDRLHAIEPDQIDSPILLTLADQSLDAESLDVVRGGFDLEGSNFTYSFGIERAVFINGELVAHTVLNLKDLQWTAGGGGSTPQLPASSAIGAVNVIQNGGGNSFAAKANPNLAGTVIQNTLNDQKIQNVTTINAVVNSAQLLRSMSVQSAVQNGIISSLRH